MYRVRNIVSCNFAHENGVYGRGVCTAILDSGIYPHADLEGRILCFRDFVNGVDYAYDDNGHGTHIAGIIGSTGYASSGKYCGMAPDCRYVVGKVLDFQGNGDMDAILKAIDWIIEIKDAYGIRILNISVGTTAKEEREEDYCLVDAVEKAWKAGIVVVAAAGNNGPRQRSITIPGISKKVITVGCSDDNIPVTINGRRKSEYSGRGPTSECICKPDIVAPGNRIVSTRNDRFGYSVKSGTSMATPVVAGAAALLLERQPWLTPKAVKQCILSSASDLNLPKNRQGFGLLNVRRLLLGDWSWQMEF